MSNPFSMQPRTIVDKYGVGKYSALSDSVKLYVSTVYLMRNSTCFFHAFQNSSQVLKFSELPVLGPTCSPFFVATSLIVSNQFELNRDYFKIIFIFRNHLIKL